MGGLLRGWDFWRWLGGGRDMVRCPVEFSFCFAAGKPSDDDDDDEVLEYDLPPAQYLRGLIWKILYGLAVQVDGQPP